MFNTIHVGYIMSNVRKNIKKQGQVRTYLGVQTPYVNVEYLRRVGTYVNIADLEEFSPWKI